MSEVPKLEPRCGSWMIFIPGCSTPLAETFSWQTADDAAAYGYVVKTAAQHLREFNAALLGEGNNHE